MRRLLVLALLSSGVSYVACSADDPGALTTSHRIALGPGGHLTTDGDGGGSSSGGSSSGGSSSGSSSSGGGPSADTLQHCVDAINAYRAQVGAPAYARSSALESFAADGAKSDSQTGQAHGHFISTSGGGVAFAENEAPGWPLAQYGSITGVIDGSLQAMWNEGPGGGHHDNMASTQYTQVGCGVFVTADASVWVTTDFK